MAVTQKDIASSLGISQPAVGAVLGSHSSRSTISIAPELRERILQRAKEMNYQPNIFAQKMRGRSTKVIGIALFTSLLQVVAERQVVAIEEIKKQKFRPISISSIIPNSSNGQEITHTIFDQLIDLKVEGALLMLSGAASSKEVVRLAKAGIPSVSLSGVPYPEIPFVGADIEQGFRLLTRHVIEQGYRRPLIVSQELSSDPHVPNANSVNPRLNGFRAEIERWGGKITVINGPDEIKRLRRSRKSSKDLHGTIFSIPGNPNFSETYQNGYRAMQMLLDLNVPVDVAMFPSDDWLQGALLAASERSIAVPEQMGLTGFDASPFGRFGSLPFTTVQQPNIEMAKQGVKTLLSIVSGNPWGGPMEVRLPCRLVPGATTRSF